MKPLFVLSGVVIRGKNRGKALGFPTANFNIDRSTPPGTYISTTNIQNADYPSVTFVGTVDTFDEKDFVGESYILDFDKDIYGEKITVNFIKKLRENQKFESVEKLIEQMKADEQQTREYFDKLNA